MVRIEWVCLLFILMACTTNQDSKMLLKDKVKELQKVQYDSIYKSHVHQEEHYDEGLSYENVNELKLIYNPDVSPFYYYFDKKEQLVIVVSFDTTYLSKLEVGVNDSDAVLLTSRLGKVYNKYVFPDKGFAIHKANEGIEALEVFNPTTLEKYKESFHEEVTFIK